jgi:hypothetical protein
VGEYVEAEYIGCKIRCQSWEGREPGEKERGLPVLEEFRVRLQQRRTRETNSGN